MRVMAAVMAMGLALAAAGVARAGDEKVALNLPSPKALDGLSSSMATPLLKSRTQVRILKHDDRLAGRCANKRFASAEIITRPTDAGSGQKKWQEQWVLNRCGTPVGYRVFFTDVGDGGAFFAFKQTN